MILGNTSKTEGRLKRKLSLSKNFKRHHAYISEKTFFNKNKFYKLIIRSKKPF